MITWKDITIYNPHDDTRHKPTSWCANIAPFFRISITCVHQFYPGEWVMHCAALGMECIKLGDVGAITVEQAQAAAKAAALARIETFRNALVGETAGVNGD